LGAANLVDFPAGLCRRFAALLAAPIDEQFEN
jgi:hypothetical protein